MNSGISCASNRELLEAASARGYGEPRRPKRSEVGGRRSEVGGHRSPLAARWSLAVPEQLLEPWILTERIPKWVELEVCNR
jgi:hypothetical protein